MVQRLWQAAYSAALTAVFAASCIENGGAKVQPVGDAGANGGAGGDAAARRDTGGDPGGAGGGVPGQSGPRLQASTSRLTVYTGGPQTLTITNAGDTPATLTQFIQSGSGAFVALVQGLDPRRAPSTLADPDADGTPGLSPGARFEVEVRLTPTDTLRERATLRVLSADEAPLEVALLNFNPEACLDATPPALAWRSRLNRSDTRPLELRPCLEGSAVVVGGLKLGGDDAAAFALAEDTPALPFTVSEPVTLGVAFTPSRPGEATANLGIEFVASGPLDEVMFVPLHGLTVENECPIAVVPNDEFRVPPLSVVTLDGSGSVDPDGPDGRPVSYEWVITERPEGSTSQPREWIPDPSGDPGSGPPDDLVTPRALFFVDLAGIYTAELRVTDNESRFSEACTPPTSAQVTIDSRPSGDVHVVLVYDAGAPVPADEPEMALDLDLHWRHPLAEGWFLAPGDCYYGNPNPDWGILGDTSDDPQLATDRPGATESLIHSNVENTAEVGAPYVLGVHGYSVPTGLSAPFSVAVFVRGEFVWASPPGLAVAQDDFCQLFGLDWPSAELTPRIECGPSLP